MALDMPPPLKAIFFVQESRNRISVTTRRPASNGARAGVAARATPEPLLLRSLHHEERIAVTVRIFPPYVQLALRLVDLGNGVRRIPVLVAQHPQALLHRVVVVIPPRRIRQDEIPDRPEATVGNNTFVGLNGGHGRIIRPVRLHLRRNLRLQPARLGDRDIAARNKEFPPLGQRIAKAHHVHCAFAPDEVEARVIERHGPHRCIDGLYFPLEGGLSGAPLQLIETRVGTAPRAPLRAYRRSGYDIAPYQASDLSDSR
jgi:hypothetical protein